MRKTGWKGRGSTSKSSAQGDDSLTNCVRIIWKHLGVEDEGWGVEACEREELVLLAEYIVQLVFASKDVLELISNHEEIDITLNDNNGKVDQDG